jgi:hypothetical protein
LADELLAADRSQLSAQHQQAMPVDRRPKFVDSTDRGSKPEHADGDPRPATAAALTGLMWYQNSAWIRGSTASLSPGAEALPN